MPAVSTAQRQMMAIAEHHPEKLYKRNRAVLDMSKAQLHDFASTKGLTKNHVGTKPRDQQTRGQRRLMDRSTAGSPPFTHGELMCGYRRIPDGK